VAVATLALGVGATTQVFTVVHGVLLSPLAFEDSHRLIAVWHTAPGLGLEEANLSAAMALSYRRENRVFEDLGFWNTARVSVSGIAEAEQVSATSVSAGLLPLLRVFPLVGRGFTEEDDAAGAPPTVLLGGDYWRRRFGGDRSVLGATLRMDGVAHEIVGILPEITPLEADLYVPMRWDPAALPVDWSYQAVGRLLPDASLEQAQADVSRMIPMLPDLSSGGVSRGVVDQARLAPDLHPMKEDFVGNVGEVLWVLLGSVGIVLLIACANVANLFMVRAESRRQELAVRTALGAGRWRIVRQLLLESLVLASIGGAVGVVLAVGGVRLLRWIEPESLPRLNEITVDPAVLGFALGASLISGILFGLLPALRASEQQALVTLEAGGRGGGIGGGRDRARSALVVAQVAMALVLLASSGLMLRSFQTLQRVDPGFDDPAEVLTFRVTIPETEVASGAEFAVALETLWRGLGEIPGVTAVGASTSVTMDGFGVASTMSTEDPPHPVQGEVAPVRRFKWVTGEYFSTMGNPVAAGRAIEWSDIHDAATVAMVTDDLVREFWGSASGALGKRLRFGNGPWREIVGVAGNVHDLGVDDPATQVVYFPLDTSRFVRMGVTYALRSGGGDPTSLLPNARQLVREVNPNVPLASVRTLDEIVADSMGRTTFTLIMIAIAATVALALGLIGIYGVLSYVVSQRRREIGVRMAVGAEGRHVRSMVVRQALTLVGAGVAIGLVATRVLTRLLASLLYGVEPTDLATLLSVTASLVLVALVACYLPAHQASKIDPMEALRVG
jgi:predicted permease